MQLVSKQWIGKHASTTTGLLLETVFSIRSVQSGYKDEKWDDQFSWTLQGKLRTDRDPVQLRIKSPAVKERVNCKSAAATRSLYVCCSYSEAVQLLC
jgi:hypothetical protein